MEPDKQFTKEAFEDEWLKAVRNGNGYMVSYHLVETNHLFQFGSRRYSNYKSFARSRDYRKK